MALQIRRGLNQERLNITPLAGEVIHVTDYRATTKLITAVADVGDTVTVTAHGWASGQQVRYRGATAYGLTQGTLYYVKNPTTNGFQLSTASNLSSTVNITGTASGLNYPIAIGPRDGAGDVIGTSVAPIWIGDGTTVGGVAAGAWTLDDLYDVEIASDSDGDGLAGDNLANEQHLEYDASTQQWYNRSDMIIPGTLLTRSNVTFGDTGNEIVTFFSPTVSAPNDLNINSGQLFVDQSTGYIGIGDTTPEHKLDVNGTIRTTGDVQIDGGDLISSTSTFNLVNTTATTVNTGGAATAYNIGHSSGTGDTYIRNDLTANQNADVLGDLTVNGNTTLGNASGDLVTVNASEILLTASQPFITFNAPGTSADGVNPIRGIRGNVTEDDYWFVGAGSSGEDDGYLLIATSDNAATGSNDDGRRERILVRRYGGNGLGHPANAPWGGAPIIDEMELFDLDGYTTIPNRLGIGITPSAKLDVNGSAIVRGTNLTVEGTIQAQGGSITSSSATLTINAGGQVTIDDNVTVTGNLTVNGTTTTINSTTLTVDDKNIELASTASPSDTTANGGGITLKGTTDKTIIWDQVTGRWTFNTDIEALGGVLGNVQAGVTTDNTIDTSTGNLVINATGGSILAECDFVAKGQLTTYDNFVLLKAGLGAGTAPSENGGISINRGSSADVQLRWNETTDRWGFTNDGTNYTNFSTQSLDTTDSPQFAGATLGNITVGVGTDNTITTTSGDLTIDAAGGDTFVESNLIAKSQLATYDNFVVLNYDVTGAPTDNAGIVVNRGTSPDVTIRWNESLGKWGYTNDGTNYNNFLASSGDSPTFLEATIGNIAIADDANDNTITTTSGDLNLDAVGGEVRVIADLVAEGELRTHDNQITFTSNLTTSPSENIDIIVERGSSTNVAIRWNETTDRWTFTNDGSTYVALATQALDTTDSPSFAGITGGNITVGVATDNTITTTSGDLTIDAAGGDTFVESNLIAKGQLNTYDNFVVLNYDVAGAPTENGGITVNRGSSADVLFRWNETTDRWGSTTDGTNFIELPDQNLDTTSAAQFASVSIDGLAIIDSATLTTSATTADQVVDSTATATYRSAKYQVQITSGSEYQALEILLIHNGTTASIVAYADVKTGSTDLATFTADISGGNFRLLTTPTNAVTTYKVTKTLITV